MNKDRSILCKALGFYGTDKLITRLEDTTSQLSEKIKRNNEKLEIEEIARLFSELFVLLDALAIEYNVEKLIGFNRLMILSKIEKEIFENE